MTPDAMRNWELLQDETNAALVTTRHVGPNARPIRTIYASGPLELRTRASKAPTDDAEIIVVPSPLFRPLTCCAGAYAADVHHTHCHDCPVPGGVQVQPDKDDWVGTLACLVRIGPPTSMDAYAALTNWHVAPVTDTRPRVELHQPYRSRSPIATCNRSAQPRAGQQNLCDAAAGSCLVDRRHTLSTAILGIGTPNKMPVDLAPGMAVHKSGRTTGVTTGVCDSVGAAVRVSYGHFTASFADQDTIRGTSGDMSAPGDSGSLVLCREHNRPAALLFAGGGGITIASPMRHVTQALGLQWPVIT